MSVFIFEDVSKTGKLEASQSAILLVQSGSGGDKRLPEESAPWIIRGFVTVGGLAKEPEAKAVDKKLGDKQVGDSLGDSKKATEKEIVQVNAQALVIVKLSHRKSIKRVNDLVDTLFEEIEVDSDEELCYCGSRIDETNPDCIEYKLCKEHAVDV